MNLLVIGASGFIGRHILVEAKRVGLSVLGTRSTSSSQGLIGFDLRRDGLGNVPGVRDWADGSVVVAAAFPQIDRCLTERDVSRAINVDGTIRILREAHHRGFRPVFLSSSFVFDGRDGHYADAAERAPISEYGRQKAEVESFVERELPSALVLRLDKTIGTVPDEKHLFSEWWAAASDRRPIRCIEKQWFSPTLVDDVARGVVAACQRGLHGIYNLAGSEVMSRVELAHRFVELSGLTVAIEEVSQRDLGFVDLRPERSSLDSSAFVRETGLRFTTLDEALRTFLSAVHASQVKA